MSKVDWVVPPSIDMQLMDGVTLLDNQGDEKAKKKQSKGDGNLLKTIFLGLDPTPNIIVISDIVLSMLASFGYGADFLLRKTVRSDNDSIRKL